MRTVLVCIAFMTVCGYATATSVLLHPASEATPELFTVLTYTGKLDATISAVRPSPALTIVLLTDTLSPAQLDSAKKDLLALYAALHKHPSRLALLRGSSLGVAGPFSSRDRLKSALDDAVRAASDPAAVSPLANINTLCAAAPQLGSDWSRVVLIGELPALDPSSLDYASALLLRAFGTQRIQLNWSAPSGGNDAWLPALRQTGGGIIRVPLSEFLASIDKSPQFFFQVDWVPATPSAGFVVSHSILLDRQAQVLLEASDIAVAPAASLPSIDDYLAMQLKTAEAATLMTQETIPQASIERVRDNLRAALEINPREAGTLVTAAAFYEKLRDYVTAAAFRSSLVEVRPLDAAAHAALGHVLLLGSDLDKAEAALNHSVDIGSRTPQIAEDFARIHFAREDDKGALGYLDEALRADPERQDLWFLEAHAADRLKNSSLAIQSFERGLALGGVHIPETASLLRLELAAKQNDKARELAHSVIAALPPDPAVRSEFAGILDDLQQSADALAAWRSVLEVRPDFDRAHYRVARLTLESGDARAAEQAADAGIAAAPKFAALYMVKADAQEQRGRRYDARKTLRQGTAVAPDPILLSRLAAAEDTYGASAAEAYARLAESLPASSPEHQRAIERGFAVSVRDNDLQHAQSFAASLKSSGHPEFHALLGTEQRADTGMLVPGGLDALAIVAHAGQGVPAERFAAEYCRTVVNQLDRKQANKAYIEAIRDHFQRIAALEASGKREGSRVVITLSLDGKNARHNTERVLQLLGIELHASKDDVTLNRGEKKDQAKRQETVSALALDEVGMQEAFQAGKSYTFEIPYERAPLYPSEKLWRETFYAKENDFGGFATAALRMPKMARLYLALNALDRKALEALLSAIPLQTLYDRYSDLLDQFAPALALEGSHAAVPGGTAAEPIWAGLAGASPDHRGALFRALLEHDNGKILAFFFTLSQLDRAHQKFFTASASRASQVYKLFVASYEIQRHHSSSIYSTFTEVLRSVPLDNENHLDFPGSPEVWTVAKGRYASESHTAKLLKKLSRAAAPEVEDEVLLRLAQTHYSDKSTRHTELENFLAVSRIDAHRAKPLDEESALLLAQHYSDSADAYPYFTDLTALEAGDFRQFFAAVDGLRSHSLMDANLRLGQFHSLIEWICLLKRVQVMGDIEAAKLFRYVCDRFAGADDAAAYTSAALDSARSILSYCKTQQRTSSADELICSCLAGFSSPSSTRRIAEFQSLLQLQMVPNLDALFSIYDAAVKLSTTGSGGISAIEKGTANLPGVTLQKGTKVEGKEKQNILRYDPAPIRKAADELRQKVAKRKAKPSDIEKLSRELLVTLEPQVTLALAGPVYGYFLRPSDLVVSQDSLLLRKHRYLDFAADGNRRQTLWESQFQKRSELAGSYFSGGFAQFALASGDAAAVGWKVPGHGGTEPIAAEIAAIRGASWDQLNESDLRLVSLRIEAAREWIFESARRPEEFRALSEETIGLLSLARRAELLSGIESRSWNQVWRAITLPDLFALGGRYLEHYKSDPWPSPVISALRAVSATNDGSRLSALAAVSYHSFGCNHPHLRRNAPYEEYEHHMFPNEIAERFAEFKLYLAYQADGLGVEPSALAGVAEALAAKAFRIAQMTDYRDWRSLLAAYSSISPDDLKQALEH